MFPIPMRFPMLMQKTWNEDTPSFPDFSMENVALHISGRFVICSPLSFIVE